MNLIQYFTPNKGSQLSSVIFWIGIEITDSAVWTTVRGRTVDHEALSQLLVKLSIAIQRSAQTVRLEVTTPWLILSKIPCHFPFLNNVFTFHYIQVDMLKQSYPKIWKNIFVTICLKYSSDLFIFQWLLNPNLNPTVDISFQSLNLEVVSYEQHIHICFFSQLIAEAGAAL